jgi:hypoxanthine phosphoribosyltransferase
MYTKEYLQKNSIEILETLLNQVLTETHVDVSFDYFKNDSWSSVTYNNYEEDIEISVRLHNNKTYDLHIGFYDKEDEFQELNHILNEEQIVSIPLGLKKVMMKVVLDEEGLRVPCSLLLGKK